MRVDTRSWSAGRVTAGRETLPRGDLAGGRVVGDSVAVQRPAATCPGDGPRLPGRGRRVDFDRSDSPSARAAPTPYRCQRTAPGRAPGSVVSDARGVRAQAGQRVVEPGPGVARPGQTTSPSPGRLGRFNVRNVPLLNRVSAGRATRVDAPVGGDPIQPSAQRGAPLEPCEAALNLVPTLALVGSRPVASAIVDERAPWRVNVRWSRT
jgi:hypothetical protein